MKILWIISILLLSGKLILFGLNTVSITFYTNFELRCFKLFWLRYLLLHVFKLLDYKVIGHMQLQYRGIS